MAPCRFYWWCLGLNLLHAETFVRGKWGSRVFCIIKVPAMLFLRQLIYLTPPRLAWLVLVGEDGWSINWWWTCLAEDTELEMESSCGRLGYVGVGSSCVRWRLTPLHSWGISKRKSECPSRSLVQGVFYVAIRMAEIWGELCLAEEVKSWRWI